MVPELTKAISAGCYNMRLTYKPKWEQWILLLSDIHFDAKGCDRRLVRQHLDQAVKRDAPIFLLGDTLDLMQGKFDPRGAKYQLRAEYSMDEDYLGSVCSDAAAFLAPYSDNLKLITMGNHEFEYRRRHEIDPLTIVATHLKIATGKAPMVGPYTGWIQFKFTYHSGGRRTSLNFKYHHGVGANAPVTRGAIQSNRSAVMWPTADIIARGHIHQRFQMSLPVELISKQGKLITDRERLYLQLGCYVQDTDGDSWSSRRGFGTAALGGMWLRLYTDKIGGSKKGIISSADIKYQAIYTD